jgi:hypothetical protein
MRIARLGRRRFAPGLGITFASSLERDCVFLAWFEADQPDAAGSDEAGAE